MLYLVSTPIGNLGDITLRALDTLKEVDWVISEDTRKTGLLLKHFGIKKPQISFYEQNEDRALPGIMEKLSQGESMALVTNAGTPGISDPGFVLVREAIRNDVPVTSIPGPTALISALVLSGLAVHSFTFCGFPPRKTGARQRFFAGDKDAAHTLIYYESPYRLVACLQDALTVFGDRQAALANDLTKLFETVYRGSLSEILSAVASRPIKGEYCLVVEGKSEKGEEEGTES
jgi:16S rRNA (cytidine1402-2'-O)-methyltransferase